jgi:hypothetical protein
MSANMNMDFENGFRPQNFSEKMMKEEIEKILKNSKNCKECQPNDTGIQDALMSTLDDDEMFSEIRDEFIDRNSTAKQINEIYQKQMRNKKNQNNKPQVDIPDTFTFSSESSDHDNLKKDSGNENGFWKFNEDKTLKAAQDYISSTYHQHYTSEESKVQVLDIIEAIGDGVPFCRDNLIKYSARFGKKNGFSKLDALKIIHYGILLYNFAGFHKNTTDRYETF